MTGLRLVPVLVVVEQVSQSVSVHTFVLRCKDEHKCPPGTLPNTDSKQMDHQHTCEP